MDKGYPELPAKLKQLIAKGEGLEIEVKETPSEELMREFSKLCASFANTQGGSIVIGVNDDRKVVGANINQQVRERISNEAANCKPPVRIELNQYQEEGKTILQVYVPKSQYIHADKSFRFPFRTGNVTSFMELGMILAYAKERKLVGEETALTYETSERRKPGKNELKPYLDGLSSPDLWVRSHALSNLSSLAFTTEIETEEKLLPRLVKLIQDSEASVRREALRLYERLLYSLPSTHKVRYNKKILPLVSKVALEDDDQEVRRQALEALSVAGDERAVKVIVRMLSKLPEEEYKAAIPGNVLNTVVHSGLGPKFRLELFKVFSTTNDVDLRRRIEELARQYYLG